MTLHRVTQNNKLAFGDYKSASEYAIIGDATAFYAWVREGQDGCPLGLASEWIKGKEAFSAYNVLKEMHRKGDKDGFIAKVKALHAAHRKHWHAEAG
jgi:hypothetical protein